MSYQAVIPLQNLVTNVAKTLYILAICLLVMGKSIVIHAEDSGAPRVACTDLVPLGTNTTIIEYQIPRKTEAFK